MAMLWKQQLLQLLKRNIYLTEAVLWIAGIVALALMRPEGEHLFSLCPLSWTGSDFCPGCGLGHAISFLLHGQWQASWQAHPLGLPALLLLLRRSINLVHWHFAFHLKPTSNQTYTHG